MTKSKIKQKNKSKRIANISLGIMGAGFLATLPFELTTPLRIVQGGFEAGLVGGLADWFAVTALFRHPLNIPIPHTALLPKNREKITNTILSIVENDWLKKESILEKLDNINFAHMMLSKAEEELKKESSKVYIQKGLNASLQYIEREKIEQLTRSTLIQLTDTIDTKKALSLVIDKALEHKYDEKMYTIVFQLIEKKLSDHETREKMKAFIIKTMEKKAENSFFKLALKPLVSVGKDKMSATLEKAIDDIMLDLKDENSENRKSILLYIQRELQNVKENQDILNQLVEKKQHLITSEHFDKMNSYIVDTLYAKLNSLINDATFIEEKVVPFLETIIQKTKENEQTITNINTAIKNTLVQFIEQNHSKIGALVRDNISKLKNEELIDMMENKIGKELSWIRVNGSICGFLIGLVLSTIKILS